MSTVIIKREKSVVGFAVAFDIFVDDIKVGGVRNGADITLEVPPGEHKISCKTPASGRTHLDVTVSSDLSEPLVITCKPNWTFKMMWPSWLLLLLTQPLFALQEINPSTTVALMILALFGLVFIVLEVIQFKILWPLKEKYGWAGLLKQATILEITTPNTEQELVPVTIKDVI